MPLHNYASINKAANDLLFKDYVHQKAWKIEHKTKSKNPTLTQIVAHSTEDVVDASSQMRLSVGDFMVDAKLELPGVSKLTVDYKFTQPSVRGLLLSTCLDESAAKNGKGSRLSVSTQYSSDAVFGKLTVDPSRLNYMSDIGFAPTTYAQGWKVGATLSGPLAIETPKYELGASYTAKTKEDRTWTVSVKTAGVDKKPIGKIIGNVHVRSPEKITKNEPVVSSEAALQITRFLSGGKTNISVGAGWVLSNPGQTSLRGRINEAGTCAVAVKHKFSDAVFGTVGAEFEALNVAEKSPFKYGVKIDVIA